MNSTILAFLRIIGALQKKLHSSSDAECKHNKIAKQQKVSMLLNCGVILTLI